MNYSLILDDLHDSTPLVNPSMLSCDFAHLEDEIRRLERAGAKILHLDIMDGHFVPNLSIGVPIVAAVRRSTDLPLDVHLMLSEPQRYVKIFRDAGADLLTFHIEAVADPRPLLDEIHKLGAIAGISLNPSTPVSKLEGCLDLCDLALVMTVMPGFGGQQFDPVALKHVQKIREMTDANMLISVDGGIQHDTIGACAQAGANVFVTGSALFSHDDYGRFIEEMTALAIALEKERTDSQKC